MKEIKKLSNEELINEFINGNHSVGEEIAERGLLLELEVAIGIDKNSITQEEVDELMKKDSETLLEELSISEIEYSDFYGNIVYIQENENDETFQKISSNLRASMSIIRLILEKRGVEVY